MSSQLKPITLYGAGGPNPPKIAMLMEELAVPYDIKAVAMGDVKGPEYTAINPNGRLPSIKDPNTGITLWESGAIIEYLIEVYDKEHRLSFAPGTPEYFHAKQWLYYQTTGQGPYYGQAVWFKKYHPEPLPSAAERYVKEINRVSGVLDAYLAKQKENATGGDGPWLVGDKFSYADLAFIQWQRVISMILSKDEYSVEKFPHVNEWMSKMTARPGVKAALEKIAKHSAH